MSSGLRDTSMSFLKCSMSKFEFSFLWIKSPVLSHLKDVIAQNMELKPKTWNLLFFFFISNVLYLFWRIAYLQNTNKCIQWFSFFNSWHFSQSIIYYWLKQSKSLLISFILLFLFYKSVYSWKPDLVAALIKLFQYLFISSEYNLGLIICFQSFTSSWPLDKSPPPLCVVTILQTHHLSFWWFGTSNLFCLLIFKSLKSVFWLKFSQHTPSCGRTLLFMT